MAIIKTFYQNSYTMILLIGLLTILFSSCSIQRNAIPPREEDPFYDPPELPPRDSGDGDLGTWRAAVYPGYACAQDEITFQWTVGDPRCPAGPRTSCQTLTVTDNLMVLEPFTSRALFGTETYGSVSSIDSWSGANPVLTFSVAHDDPGDPGWTNINDEVVIIRKPPAPAIGRNFDFTAVCNPDTGRWDLTDFRLNMGREPFIEETGGLGPCVRINSVCYNGEGTVNYNPVIISVIGGEGPRTSATLRRGDCVDNIALKPDLHYQAVPDPSNPITSTMGGNCIEGSTSDPVTPAPYIRLQFSLTCDTTLPECGN